jgi:hypothetical protein
MRGYPIIQVELIGPNGDVAYATVVGGAEEGGEAPAEQRIRIGQGFPVERTKGWASPLW